MALISTRQPIAFLYLLAFANVENDSIFLRIAMLFIRVKKLAKPHKSLSDYCRDFYLKIC